MIRLAQTNDAERIFEIQQSILAEENQVVANQEEFFETVEQVEEWIRFKLSKDYETIFVAEVDNKVVGWIMFQSYNQQNLEHIGRVSAIVDKQYRCKGIGTKLITTLLEWAVAMPLIEKVRVGILSTNKQAIQLYKKMGFIEEGRKVDEVKIGSEYIDEILVYKMTRYLH